MWRLIKALIFVLVLGGLGLIAFAYVGPILGADFSPTKSPVSEPVELDLGS